MAANASENPLLIHRQETGKCFLFVSIDRKQENVSLYNLIAFITSKHR